MVISVYPTSNYWSASIRHQASQYVRHSERRYKTRDEAKLAAFEVMISWLEKKLWESPIRAKRPR